MRFPIISDLPLSLLLGMALLTGPAAAAAGAAGAAGGREGECRVQVRFLEEDFFENMTPWSRTVCSGFLRLPALPVGGSAEFRVQRGSGVGVGVGVGVGGAMEAAGGPGVQLDMWWSGELTLEADQLKKTSEGEARTTAKLWLEEHALRLQLQGERMRPDLVLRAGAGSPTLKFPATETELDRQGFDFVRISVNPDDDPAPVLTLYWQVLDVGVGAGGLEVVQMQPQVVVHSSFPIPVLAQNLRATPERLFETTSLRAVVELRPGLNVLEGLRLRGLEELWPRRATQTQTQSQTQEWLETLQVVTSEVAVEARLERGAMKRRLEWTGKTGWEEFPDFWSEGVRRVEVETEIPSGLRIGNFLPRDGQVFRVTGDPSNLLEEISASERNFRLTEGGLHEVAVLRGRELTLMQLRVSEIATREISRLAGKPLPARLAEGGSRVRFFFSLAAKIEEIWLGTRRWRRGNFRVCPRSGIVELEIPEGDISDHLLSLVVADDEFPLLQETRTIFEVELQMSGKNPEKKPEKSPPILSIIANLLLRVSLWFFVLGAVLFPQEVEKFRASLDISRFHPLTPLSTPPTGPSTGLFNTPVSTPEKKISENFPRRTSRSSAGKPRLSVVSALPEAVTRPSTEETKISVEDAIAASRALHARKCTAAAEVPAPVEPVAAKKKPEKKKNRISAQPASAAGNIFDSTTFFSYEAAAPPQPEPEISDLPPEVLEALAALLTRLNDEFASSPPPTHVAGNPYFF